LRDVVVERLGGPEPFEHFCAIGDAIVHGTLKLPAQKLADELTKIRAGLDKLTLADLVVGPDTARTLSLGQARLPSARAISESEREAILPAGDSSNLADYFDIFLGSALGVCQAAAKVGQFVELVDL